MCCFIFLLQKILDTKPRQFVYVQGGVKDKSDEILTKIVFHIPMPKRQHKNYFVLSASHFKLRYQPFKIHNKLHTTSFRHYSNKIIWSINYDQEAPVSANWLMRTITFSRWCKLRMWCCKPYPTVSIKCEFKNCTQNV